MNEIEAVYMLQEDASALRKLLDLGLPSEEDKEKRTDSDRPKLCNQPNQPLWWEDQGLG